MELLCPLPQMWMAFDGRKVAFVVDQIEFGDCWIDSKKIIFLMYLFNFIFIYFWAILLADWNYFLLL
jgi:hypothetical protein